MSPPLDAMRLAIDEIDRRVVALVAERFAITTQIGTIKIDSGLPASDGARRDHRAALLRELAALHGLDPELVLGVYAPINREVVDSHRRMGARDAD